MANEAPNLGYITILNSDGSVASAPGLITAIAASGQIVEGTVPAQLPSVACKLAILRAYATNPTDIFIGVDGSVAVEGTVTSTHVGFKLEPGKDTGWMPVPNLNLFYAISEGTANILNYLALF